MCWGGPWKQIWNLEVSRISVNSDAVEVLMSDESPPVLRYLELGDASLRMWHNPTHAQDGYSSFMSTCDIFRICGIQTTLHIWFRKRTSHAMNAFSRMRCSFDHIVLSQELVNVQRAFDINIDVCTMLGFLAYLRATCRQRGMPRDKQLKVATFITTLSDTPATLRTMSLLPGGPHVYIEAMW